MSITRTMDAIYSFRFINLMRKPFTDWEEYKLGIIDADGNVLRRAKTAKEKELYSRFHQLVRALKRYFVRMAGAAGISQVIGKSGRASYVFETLCEEFGEPSEKTLNECLLTEEMVAGDAGGDAQKIATGENSGSVTGPGAGITIHRSGRMADKKKKK
ncbi:MAG: hypothetical protein ACRC3J_09120 [Culicoidibacterales bacterium]